ncbi:DUF3800 domain-containing protein [Curtanaerobium respiraculi]|uniref:DUF3800 domain-containing protein n=1 Tax=Curtanaerobium respiraculi TaxID=2949669 RepID=UPI0024B3318B|nr:DUF3800 domain-containing protein [Curtanaerobium respiraculi]
MREGSISLFCDESGNVGKSSKYYLVTLVFHDQSDDISGHLAKYDAVLKQSGIQDVPFHMTPLLRAHNQYKDLDIQTRKRMLSKFSIFAQHLPYEYHTFSYRKSEFATDDEMFARMRRDLVTFLFDHLGYLQSFDQVKLYYDDGQDELNRVLHSAIEYAISKEAYIYRDARPQDYRLAQVADFVCGIELTELKYAAKEATATDETFFGGSTSFKKNFLKQVRKHLLA